jgi:hypothetical protein
LVVVLSIVAGVWLANRKKIKLLFGRWWCSTQILALLELVEYGIAKNSQQPCDVASGKTKALDQG